MSKMTRILIADDHAIVREGLRIMTSSIADVEVVGEARNGVEAVEAAHRLHPNVILMDIDMPEMNGIEATRRLADEMPEIRTLVLTVYEDDDPIFEAVQAGAAGYLSKSATVCQISAAIAALGAGGAYLAPEDAAKTLRVLSSRADAVAESARTEVNTTTREGQVLRLLSRGFSARKIASELEISERTVNSHVGHLYRRLGVNNRVDAVREAIRIGLVAAPV